MEDKEKANRIKTQEKPEPKAPPKAKKKTEKKPQAQSKRKPRVWKATFIAQRMIKRNTKVVLTADGNKVALSGFRLVDIE